MVTYDYKYMFILFVLGMATYPLERNYFPVPSFNDIKVNVDNMRDNLIDGLVNATCDGMYSPFKAFCLVSQDLFLQYSRFGTSKIAISRILP